MLAGILFSGILKVCFLESLVSFQETVSAASPFSGTQRNRRQEAYLDLTHRLPFTEIPPLVDTLDTLEKHFCHVAVASRHRKFPL